MVRNQTSVVRVMVEGLVGGESLTEFPDETPEYDIILLFRARRIVRSRRVTTVESRTQNPC